MSENEDVDWCKRAMKAYLPRLNLIDKLRGKYIRLNGMCAHEYIRVGGYVGGMEDVNAWGSDQHGNRCNIWIQEGNHAIIDDGWCAHCGERLIVPAIRHRCDPDRREKHYLRTIISKWQDHYHKLGPAPIAETVEIIKEYTKGAGDE